MPSASIFLNVVAGSKLPIVSAHAEGKCAFADDGQRRRVDQQICMRYLDNRLNATEHYPQNPNGSSGGVTGVCSEDGRATIMMPHPERLFRSCQFSYLPRALRGRESPWLETFRAVRRYF